jgi:UDP-N-acetylmuramoyl-tripeptide--D-alanyl-D-alanine ligase
MFKAIIQFILELLVKRYLAKHKPLLVVLTGSVGKTSTKIAVATVLAETLRVRTHEGNFNTHLSAPVAILGIEYPDDVKSMAAWFNVVKAAWQRIKGDKDVDVIVQELGTDHPGDIARFGKYLNPAIAVVTAVSPEHMEFFGDVAKVAAEELKVTEFSAYSVINRDDVSADYADLAHTSSLTTYGLGANAEYLFVPKNFSLEKGYDGTCNTPTLGEFSANVHVASEQTLKSAVAAVAVAARLGLTAEQIKKGLALIRPVHGRMNLLRGVNGSTIIDDTYNSSPLAAEAALKTLYGLDAPQRIVVLGSMNELGASSESLHEEVGRLCDPTLLAWVITIGEDAAKWLAPAARARGCQVKSFKSPYAAGAFAHSVVEEGGIVLVKGSQNGVFAEEAVKLLLHSTDDEAALVRQSPSWITKKEKQFL